MTPTTYRCMSTVAAALASLSVARPASAESRSVAAVAPDPQLVRALDVALAPWGTNITEVHPIGAEVSTSLSPDRARAIADETHADVVLWVSGDGGHYTIWIYDVASDHTSSRQVNAAPPFDPTTAAAVALSVKALLRSTVVAPLPERTVPPPEEPAWVLGLSAGVADHLGAPQTGQGLEGRFGLRGSAWPDFAARRLGFAVEASVGTGVRFDSGAIATTLKEYAFDVGLATRLVVSPAFAVEPSLSAAFIVTEFNEPVGAFRRGACSGANPVTCTTVGVQPAVAACLTPFGSRLRLAPWVGITLLTLGVGLSYNNGTQHPIAPVVPEGGLRVELAWP